MSQVSARTSRRRVNLPLRPMTLSSHPSGQGGHWPSIILDSPLFERFAPVQYHHKTRCGFAQYWTGEAILNSMLLHPHWCNLASMLHARSGHQGETLLKMASPMRCGISLCRESPNDMGLVKLTLRCLSLPICYIGSLGT